MNVLVTGTTGFIGSHLCRELVQRGYRVFGLSHSDRVENIRTLLPQKEFRLLRGDIQDVNTIYNTMKENNIKAVFHLAAYIPQREDISNPFLCFDINARGTLNVLNAAYLNGLDKFIYSSSMGVYSEPPKYLPVDEKHPVEPCTIYGVSKLEGELYCGLYSKAMNIMVLRYTGVYGKGQREYRAIPTFIKQALNYSPITIYGNGTQTSDFVYVKDVVQANLLALERNKPGVYNIGSGEEISVADLAKRIVNLTKSKTEVALADQDSVRPFRFVYDITKARKVLGYSPRSLNEGLLEYIREVTEVI